MNRRGRLVHRQGYTKIREYLLRRAILSKIALFLF